MYTDILIGLMTGLVSRIASGFIVYLITKQKEESRFVFQFWMDFLFKVMERNEVYCPTEQLRYISKVGKREASGMVLLKKFYLLLIRLKSRKGNSQKKAVCSQKMSL